MLGPPRIILVVSIVSLLVLSGTLMLPVSAQEQQSGPRFSEWSMPLPLPELNTSAAEYPNGISRDGLSLYFHRSNPGTGEDLYVVHKSELGPGWDIPIKLPDTINTNYSERAAFISANGHWLFFGSDRPNGIGGNDLYVSWRSDVHSDDAWEPAVNLSAVNSVGFDSGPTVFEDEASGTMQLYFNSAPFPGGTQAKADIYVSILGPEGFGLPSPVTELNSTAQEGRPYLRRDGREIFFQSNRDGVMKIWTSTRASTTEPWSQPVIAVSPADLNDSSVTYVGTPVLSWDWNTLYVGVIRPGIDMGDVYAATRVRVHAK